MTRRLTISGSRSEMGLLNEPSEPETPPPVWTPAKQDFWRKPSKWQICMPRVRFIAKIVLSFVVVVTLFRVLTHNSTPPPPPPAPNPPPAPVPEPPKPKPEPKEPKPPHTEEEMREIAKKEAWIWKGFPL